MTMTCKLACRFAGSSVLQEDRASRRLEVDEHGLPLNASTDIWSATTSRAPSRPASASTSQAPSRCLTPPCPTLYCTPLHCTVHYAVLRWTLLITLRFTALEHATLESHPLQYTTVHSIAQHSTAQPSCSLQKVYQLTLLVSWCFHPDSMM